MDLDLDPSDPNYRIHIHNFSLFAIRSYILEVKKYPIVYNGNTRVPSSYTLIDIAWSRIAAALLDNSVNFELAQKKGYWDRSFRELWKWMRTVLKKDMISRRSKSIHIRSSELNWVEYLNFLEPYIQLGGDSSADVSSDSQLDPDIHIWIQAPGAVFTTKASHPTVIWLRDSSEDADKQGIHISICLRIPAEISIDFNKNPLGLVDLCQVTECNNVPIDTFTHDFDDFSDAVSLQAHVSSGSSQSDGAVQNIMQDGILPLQAESISTFIDEEFQYIMALLPTLHALEPRKKAEMKVQIIQALHDIL